MQPESSILFDLPDPSDRSVAWRDGKPAYFCWWERLRDREDALRHVSDHSLYLWYSHAVPDLDALSLLSDIGPLLEVGAGTGYWSRLLRDCGVDVIASEPDPQKGQGWVRGQPWTELLVADDAIVEQYPERTLLVIWPPRPDDYAERLADTAPQQRLALITDGPATWVSSDPLYDSLYNGWRVERELEIPTWPGRGDSLVIWTRQSG